MAQKKLKAPFPYFGGKISIVELVWSLLGDPDNYIEQFAGTAIALLRRPKPGKVETINDANHYVANFWRAVQADPDRVADFADGPVSEIDLHARHRYLCRGPDSAEFYERMKSDPEYFDPKFAGWWAWGQCCWIGGGWCQENSNTNSGQDARPSLRESSEGGVRPITGHGNSKFGVGVNGEPKEIGEWIPDLAGNYGATGRGVASSHGHNKRIKLTGTTMERRMSSGRPQLGDVHDIGRGVNSNRNADTLEVRRAWLVDWMRALQNRLRMVRICYGHWIRICNSKTTMQRLGSTGAFVDPPYSKNIERMLQWRQYLLTGQGIQPDPPSKGGTNRSGYLHANDQDQDADKLVAEVNIWCLKWGAVPRIRIVLCGYSGEHDNLIDAGWTEIPWKAQGGYANRNSDNENKNRERIWASPNCLKIDKLVQREMFS